MTVMGGMTTMGVSVDSCDLRSRLKAGMTAGGVSADSCGLRSRLKAGMTAMGVGVDFWDRHPGPRAAILTTSSRTACGAPYIVIPDSALPTLLSSRTMFHPHYRHPGPRDTDTIVIPDRA